MGMRALIDRWASGQQTKQAEEWIAKICTMDGSAVGFLLACATNERHKLEAAGCFVRDSGFLRANPMVPYKLARQSNDFHAQGRVAEEIGFKVWLYTSRALLYADQKHLGVTMWRQLVRGIPYVEEAATDFAVVAGLHLSISGFEELPKGLASDAL